MDRKLQERLTDRDPVTKYIEMLEGSVLMCLTAFNNIRNSKNLSAAKQIARTTSEGIESYAKAFTKS